LRTGERSAFGQLVVMTARAQDSESTAPRLGITVGKRVGNAVVRNHVKRRVREWFRHERGRFLTGTEIVVIGRRGSGDLSGREIGALLDKAVTRQSQTIR
jgi:ribonuclease P protein component